MEGHLKRIFLGLVIFIVAAIIYHAWRIQRPGFGLFDVLNNSANPTSSSEGEKYTAQEKPRLSDSDVPGLAKFSEESAKLAGAVLPSVVSVNINAKKNIPILRDALGRIWSRQVDDRRLGSGVIISKEGHVITNYHVVQGTQKVQVTTNDRKTYNAEVIGGDPKADIAVIRIITKPGDRTEFPALSFANSNDVKVGQVCFAVGNPFGLSGTVTQGIISATQRRLSDDGNDLIQTDTVINPGNSGGPLVNIRGEIVGINVAIFIGDGNVHVWQGVGLAIPANDAQTAFKAIMSRGSGVAAQGYLGLKVIRDTVAVDSSLGAKHGAIVAEVMEGSPAAQAGLQEGDIILGFDKRPFNDPSQLMQLINGTPPGKQVEVMVLRDGHVFTLTATVQQAPAKAAAKQAGQ